MKTWELGSKIRELRTGLGLLQSQFAEKLGVSRTRVVAWEKASATRPSTDHLLQMARLASDNESQLWFLECAGVDSVFFRNALIGQLRERIVFQPNALMRLPIITHPDEIKSGTARDSTAPGLPWFVNALPHPEITFALRPSFGSSVPDSELSFAVVDAFPRDPWQLLGKWVAVYFRALDVNEAVKWMTDSERDEFLNRNENEPFEGTVADATMLAGFFVGPLYFLVEEFRQKRNSQLPWHVGLEMRDDHGVPFNEPISHVCHEDPSTCKLEEQLRPGCELVGEVIGWTR
jgi:transcriptional regulator with XRE-family HTH domain